MHISKYVFNYTYTYGATDMTSLTAATAVRSSAIAELFIHVSNNKYKFYSEGNFIQRIK